MTEPFVPQGLHPTCCACCERIEELETLAREDSVTLDGYATRIAALEEALREVLREHALDDVTDNDCDSTAKARALIGPDNTASVTPVEDLPGARFASAGDDLLRKDRT